ncbi:hypothetical protein ACLB6G_16445 [Zhengella sp. ZM62]|uniref:hypothetical protein n=1 Tax=Zhengella sedimenti TaxID=3390035 RepID=UPI003976E42B
MMSKQSTFGGALVSIAMAGMLVSPVAAQGLSASDMAFAFGGKAAAPVAAQKLAPVAAQKAGTSCSAESS